MHLIDFKSAHVKVQALAYLVPNIKVSGHRGIPYFHFTKLWISFPPIYFLQNKSGHIIQREIII